MSSEIVGMPAPRQRPDRPVPPELAGSSSHGYNCRCVARHFGIDVSGYGEVPACHLSRADYQRLRDEADEAQAQAKQLSVSREVVAAKALYVRMRQTAARLDRMDIELAAVSDLAEVCYASGDLRAARQCADAVLQVAAVATVAMVHFGQYAELRSIEGSREVAEKVLIALCTEEDDLGQARALIARQRARHLQRQADPGQFPVEQLDELGTYELELRIFEVRILIAEAGFAAAREQLDLIIAELQDLGGDRVASLLAMARAELVRLRQDGGQGGDALAEMIRLRTQLLDRGDLVAAAKVDIQLAQAQALGGDVQRAVRTIVDSRERLVAAGLTGDVADAGFALGTILMTVGELGQAREQFTHAAHLWEANGDAHGARRLDFVLAQCDAAERLWESALHRAHRAQAAAQASGAWLECVRADFLTAVILHARAHEQRPDGAPVLSTEERIAIVREALELLLPAALAADDYRFQFPSAAERTAWARSVAAPAMQLVMAVLTQLGESRLVAEMVERTCSVGSFTESSAAVPLDITALQAPPQLAPQEGLPLAAFASVTTSLPLRLAPPPTLRWSPASPMRLRRWLQLATDRYGLAPQQAAEVATW